MVQRDVDPLTGRRPRRHPDQRRGHGATATSPTARAITLRSGSGVFTGRVRRARIKPGNLEVHWPEGNVLLAGDRLDPDSLEPDYNAVVTIEPVGQP